MIRSLFYTTNPPKTLWHTGCWQPGMQYSLERLCYDSDLQIPHNKCEWARKRIKPNLLSFLTQKAVFFKPPPSSFDYLLSLSPTFKEFKIVSTAFKSYFSPLYLWGIQLLVHEKGHGFRTPGLSAPLMSKKDCFFTWGSYRSCSMFGCWKLPGSISARDKICL